MTKNETQPQWYQSKEFKALQKKWYAKAEKSGFDDQEVMGTNLLKHNKKTPRTDSGSKAMKPLEYESTTEYYSRISQFLHANKFRNNLEFTIWELVCEGQTLREIAKQVKKSLKVVFTRVNKLKKEYQEWWIQTEPQREWEREQERLQILIEETDMHSL